MAFKVGDRVRVLVDRPSNAPLKKGQIVEIQSFDNGIETTCGWAVEFNEIAPLIKSCLTPAQITELLHEAEHDIFVAEQRKHDLLTALELVNKGYKVELPDA